MASAPYNPGKPSPARLIGPDRFAVDSFRGKEASYEVDLNAGTCNCPHFRTRLAGSPGAECKHLQEVRRQSKWLLAYEKARQLSDGELRRFGVQYAGNPVIAGAIIAVQAERKAEARRDAELRAIFE